LKIKVNMLYGYAKIGNVDVCGGKINPEIIKKEDE
jgi:hypothetical protein